MSSRETTYVVVDNSDSRRIQYTGSWEPIESATFGGSVFNDTVSYTVNGGLTFAFNGEPSGQ